MSKNYDPGTTSRAPKYCCNFVNTEFIRCQFEDCIFEEAMEFQSITFMESQLQKVIFREANLNQSSFQEDTVLTECVFENSNLIGSSFWKMTLRNTLFNLSHFNQTNSNECVWEKVRIQQSNIYKTVFYDTHF